MKISSENGLISVIFEHVPYEADYPWIYGSIQFCFNGICVPNGRVDNHTLPVVFLHLVRSFDDPYYWNGLDEDGAPLYTRKQVDLGDMVVELRHLDYGDIQNILELGLADMEQSMDVDGNREVLRMWLGYNGKFERLFYSTDDVKTIHEAVFPRGTVESLARRLPIQRSDFEKLGMV